MDIKDVENLAELAKIDLTNEEKQNILKDMEGILAYVKMVEEVDIPDVMPKYDIYNVWRDDEGKDPVFSKEQIVGQFPDSENNFLKVKKIL